jgi:hypothetical protein
MFKRIKDFFLSPFTPPKCKSCGCDITGANFAYVSQSGSPILSPFCDDCELDNFCL